MQPIVLSRHHQSCHSEFFPQLDMIMCQCLLPCCKPIIGAILTCRDTCRQVFYHCLNVEQIEKQAQRNCTARCGTLCMKLVAATSCLVVVTSHELLEGGLPRNTKVFSLWLLKQHCTNELHTTHH